MTSKEVQPKSKREYISQNGSVATLEYSEGVGWWIDFYGEFLRLYTREADAIKCLDKFGFREA